MSKGKIVKEINRQLIRTKDSIHFDIYAPRDKQVLAEQLSYKEAEDYCRKHTEYVAYPVSEKKQRVPVPVYNPYRRPAPGNRKTRHAVCAEK